jgi:hypothetical protein
MKLIEAFIMAQNTYGVFGDWKASHADGCYIGCNGSKTHPSYLAYGIEGDVIARCYRLETALSDFAEQYPYQVLDERWKVSRWE